MKSGASVDGHLIFHPDSFIPRSALINMTANILDIPVNVFEMAARVEGVETLIEDMFGPGGYFPDNSIVKIFDYTFSKEDKAKLRTKRSYNSVQQNIEQLHEKVSALIYFIPLALIYLIPRALIYLIPRALIYLIPRDFLGISRTVRTELLSKIGGFKNH